jgi:hypothetical protein
MKKRVILLTGTPNQGKTYLMTKLEQEASCRSLCVDIAYNEFMKTQCPGMYFENLHSYVGPHYDSLIEGLDAYSFVKSGRYFDAEWQAHLVNRIHALASVCDSVFAEGYLLKTSVVGQIHAALAPLARVFALSVQSRRYFLGSKELTFEQVVALGT